MSKAIASEAEIEAAGSVRFFRRAVHYYLRGYHRIRTLTPCTVPTNGAVILVSNHISGLDPVVLQDACPQRLVHWMMAREYYEFPLLKRVYETIHAIPVERSGRDLASTRAALRVLHEQKALGIFPEGKIGLSGQVLPFQTGVALLAIKSGAAICPAYLDGSTRNTEMTEAFMEPHEIAMAFGPLLRFGSEDTSREALEEATQRIHNAVSDLRDRFFPFSPAQPPTE